MGSSILTFSSLCGGVYALTLLIKYFLVFLVGFERFRVSTGVFIGPHQTLWVPPPCGSILQVLAVACLLCLCMWLCDGVLTSPDPPSLFFILMIIFALCLWPLSPALSLSLSLFLSFFFPLSLSRVASSRLVLVAVVVRDVGSLKLVPALGRLRFLERSAASYVAMLCAIC